MTYSEVSFSLDKSGGNLKELIKFCKEAGIFDLFKENDDLYEYLLGVEVGMDTNARKNRSGVIMEKVIEQELNNFRQMFGFELLKQQKFSVIFKKYGEKFPSQLGNRKFDFLVRSHSKLINIEVNVYNVPGSKPQEIVDSYIERQKELKSFGWNFIWITDGPAWRKMEEQLKKAFKELDYILNLNMVRQGVLAKILEKIIS